MADVPDRMAKKIAGIANRITDPPKNGLLTTKADKGSGVPSVHSMPVLRNLPSNLAEPVTEIIGLLAPDGQPPQIGGSVLTAR